MPKEINGKPLTRKEHEIWRSVYDSTDDGAKATGAVINYRQGRGPGGNRKKKDRRFKP